MQQKSKTTAWQNTHRARQTIALRQEKKMQNREPEFYVEVSRPGPQSWRTATDFELPASQSLIKDALQKARITNEQVTYGFELLGCKRGYLRPHIKGDENLNALNELAKLLQKFDYNEAMKFQTMVSIEAARSDGSLTLQQLSNFANSTCNCHVVGNICNDEQLGRFLLDADMLSDADYEWIEERQKTLIAAESFAFLGKNHREVAGGAITNIGYVEFDGDVNEFVPLDAPDTIVQFHDARCVDCIIPQAADWINAAVDKESVESFLAAVTEFHKNGELTQYKALLEAKNCTDLDTAVQLADEIYNYDFDPENCIKPAEYAAEKTREALEFVYGVEFSEVNTPYALGTKLMELDGVNSTSYGELRQIDAPEQTMRQSQSM